MWYSESHISRLSVVTTVHSYIYAGTLRSAQTKSNIHEDLNELRQLKTHLENLIEKYSEAHQHNNATNKPIVSLPATASSNQRENSTRLVGTSSQNETSTIIRPIHANSITSTEDNSKSYSDSSTIIPHNIPNTEASEAEREHNIVTLQSTTTDQINFQTTEESSENKSDVDLLVRSRLLQALMNGTVDTNKPQSQHSITKPGCKSTGEFPSEESKSIWLNFKHSLEAYANFHREELQKLKAGNRSVRTLTWSCHDPVKCAGIGDQLYRIQEVLVFAIAFKRVLALHWNPASYETTKYLRPNKIDWTYFNRSQGMHEYHEVELRKIKVMDTAKEFEPLYSLLADENRMHVTVNHELQVPFLRGMSKAIKTNTGMHAVLKESGFAALITDRKHRVPINFLSGELLRYLFHFRVNVVNKVDQLQQQLGIADKPYLALHIRTGFLGMKQEESGTFNSNKIYRNPSDWEKSLSCSVDLTGRLYGPETPIFLATDSSKVKELALQKYEGRFAMINVTLQHVAFTDVKDKSATSKLQENISSEFAEPKPTENTSPILNIGDVDGYTATWIEFLLLARASAMVHSISGFSSTAAQYCSMHSQYHVPNCKA